MDRFRRIIFVLCALCPLIFAACGIGTGSGNPEQPPVVASAASDTNEETYSDDELGIELSYADGWSLGNDGEENDAGSGNGDVQASEDSEYDPAPYSSELIGHASFSDGSAPNPTTVDIYVSEFDTAPASLYAYLEYAAPGTELASYSNRYHRGYIIDTAEVGPNGGDAKEIYFLKGKKLLRIVAELFDTGSGDFEAETIFQSVHITE